jgi:hypothetical protein
MEGIFANALVVVEVEGEGGSLSSQDFVESIPPQPQVVPKPKSIQSFHAGTGTLEFGLDPSPYLQYIVIHYTQYNMYLAKYS